MKEEQYISLKTFCERHGIVESFVYSMYELEILQVDYGKKGGQIHVEELPRLEKMVRLHNELDINPEGIQAIYHLLGQVENLQQELFSLKKKLHAME